MNGKAANGHIPMVGNVVDYTGNDSGSLTVQLLLLLGLIF